MAASASCGSDHNAVLRADSVIVKVLVVIMTSSPHMCRDSARELLDMWDGVVRALVGMPAVSPMLQAGNCVMVTALVVIMAQFPHVLRLCS